MPANVSTAQEVWEQAVTTDTLTEAVGMSNVPFVVDRSMLVPQGHVVKSGYVPIERVRLLCRERMAVGDVDRAYQRALQAAPGQVHPCVNGRWEDDPEGGKRFLILDGRHTYIALLMLGFQHILVEWVEGDNA